MTTNEEMLGRADVNDLEAILAITAKDADAGPGEIETKRTDAQ